MTLTKSGLNSRTREDFSVRVHSGQVVFVASHLQMQWQQNTSPQHDTSTGVIPANPTGLSGKIPENSYPSRSTGEFIKSSGFSKIECTATSRDRTRAEYSKPRADSVLPRVLTSFLLEISVGVATCRLKACFWNCLPCVSSWITAALEEFRKSCRDVGIVERILWDDQKALVPFSSCFLLFWRRARTEQVSCVLAEFILMSLFSLVAV